MVQNERDNTKTWVEKYEGEQQDNTLTKQKLLDVTAFYKDLQLQNKNLEIKIAT